MKKLIREFFFLRKGERRALYIVLCILTSTAVIRILYSSRPLPAYAPDEVFVRHMESIRRQVDSALQQEAVRKKYASWSGHNGSYDSKSGSGGRSGNSGSTGFSPGNSPDRRQGDAGVAGGRGKPLAPVSFDPNTVSFEALRAMNLSAYVSRNIIRYREAGGSFREPSDLAKIYGLSQEDFETLRSYIEIRSAEGQAGGVHPGSEPVKGAAGPLSSNGQSSYGSSRDQSTSQAKNGYWSSPGSWGNISSTGEPGKWPPHANQSARWSDTLSPLELNRVDSVDLLVLPGIGPWFAGRIIRYRDLLGGYVDPAQLLEVYGMDSARFSGIASFLTADTSLINHIDLNYSTFQEVISHPYINREETYAIFRYREFMDTIPGPEKLLNDQIIDHERFMRMSPYLSVSNHAE